MYTEILPRGANLGYGQKRASGSSMVSCEVLHSRGGENDTSPAPLKYGPARAPPLPLEGGLDHGPDHFSDRTQFDFTLSCSTP